MVAHRGLTVVQLLLVSSISRPSLFSFGFDLDQSQGKKPLTVPARQISCFIDTLLKHHSHVLYRLTVRILRIRKSLIKFPNPADVITGQVLYR